MEEYEVDLRDYFRVMWERKWVIAGVFLVAVLAASLYSYRLPDEYEASALLRWESGVDVGRKINLPSIESVIELLEAGTMPSDTELRAGLLGNVRRGTDFIEVRLRGPLPPEDLEKLLLDRIENVRTLLWRELQADLEEGLAAISRQIESLLQRREALLQEVRAWMGQRLEDLRRQEEELRLQLQRAVEGSKDEQVQGMLPASGVLTQLQVLIQERLRLQGEWESPYPRPGSGFDTQLDQLEGRLGQLREAEAVYRSATTWLRQGPWDPLRIVQAPQATTYPVGPPRQLNIAIAGILGLFVGILLAFFVHYLQSEPLHPESPVRPTPTTEEGRT